MKNFTKQNFKTNPLWIRLLIMTFMLLAGAGNVWAAWYLKGDFNSWNINNELKGSGNDLTTTVELKSGSTYAFKIHNAAGNNEWYGNSGTIKSDCTWTFSGNDGDAHITASISGLYTFTFNKSTKKLTVVYPKPTYLLGTLTDWTNGSELPCSINLQANTAYEFKIKQGDTWYGNGGTMTADNSKGWTFGSDNQSNCHIQTSLAGDYYFSLLWEGNIPSISVSYPCDVENSTEIRIECISTSGCPNLHAWTSNSEAITGEWPGKAMIREGNTNIYYYVIERETYKGSTVNIIFNGNDEPQTADIKELEWGKVHRYTRGGVLVYSDCLHEDCTTAEFSVNSLSNLAVGCTATASITGDNVTVTWSSSETSVASIDPNTGVITAEAAGETTITATTTDADGFCAGVVKETTLTVKSPSVLVEANKTSLCAGEELILIATVTNAGTGNTYQWYKGDNSISGATSATYTINSVSTDDAATYKVAVSGGILCQAKESAGVTVAVNALPFAPTFTTNSAQVCSGVAFNLNEKFPRKSGEAGTLTWYKTSDDSQVTDPASVTITEATSYYAKATNNNCTSGKSFDCTVNVDAKPILELASTPTVCPNVEIDLDNYVTSNTGTLTWYSNQERTTVITDGLVTPTERTTYYAKVINGTCNPVENEFTVDVYGIPDEMPAYTSTPATSCKGTPNSDGSIALKNTIGYITYTLDGKEGDSNVWTRLSVGTHKLAATINTCPSLTKEWDVEVEVEDITPAATVSITGDASFCEGGNTVLTSVVTATQGEVTAYQWYNGEELIQGATASRYTANAAGNYKVVVTVENKGCEDTFNATKEVSVKNKPTTPAFNPNFTSICVGGSTTLASGYSWYTDLNASALANLTVSPQTETTYYAIKEEKGCTSDAGTFTVKVNPLPRITAISVNNSTPVINEDVLLTVEGSDIARVEWSITSGNNASLSDASGNSVKLTSTASGAVNVTATAISINGCRATSTKEVTFKAVDECEPNVTTHTTKTKIRAKMKEGQTSWNVFKIYSYGVTDSDSNGWPGAEMDLGTGEDEGYYVYTFEDATADFNIILNNGNSGGENQTVSGAAKAGKIYTFEVGAKACSQDNDTRRCLESSNVDFTTTSDPELSAPAVKTVSATSEEGSGIVTFTGKVLKTGCANGDAIWVGYQYKKANEAWPTTGVTAGSGEKQLVTITNNPGSEDFTANVEGLEDVDYHFRAYIINGYDFTNGNYDQGVYYGLDKLVTVSTVKAPVTKATIQLTDEEGIEDYTNKKYCVGETGYIKVTSDVKYTTIKWKTDKGTEIEETGNNGIYPFVAKGDDNIWVMLSNKHNDIDRPAINQEPLVVNTFADPILPRVSLNKVSICSNDAVGATVKLTNVVKGQTYQLYQQIDNGDDTFTEQAIGDAKTQIEDVTDKTELVLHTLTNTAATGKYFVKTYTTVCEENIVATQPFTFTVVDAAEVFISIDPASAETTPWMPAKFTVNASDKYTLNVTKGIPAEPATEVEVNQNGNKVSVKIPLPQGSTLPEGTTGVYGQYENVVFPQNATTQYTITATLSATGGDDNPCATPANATINLVPYVEECTIGH